MVSTPSDAATALDYARRVFDRQRVPLPPLGFQVDWADQPSRHKLYTDVVKVPLPEPSFAPPHAATDAVVRAACGPAAATAPPLGALASLLGCNGLADRRTEPNWNDDSDTKLRSDRAAWARPTASGGGMYPAESYLVTGRSGPLPPGVYHYDTAHHSLDLLSDGDRRHAIAAATGTRAELYVIATVRFWKNAFKYNTFSYHVVTQDVGALLASWRLVLAARGAPVEPVLWFDEQPVSEVLGVDGHDEAPFVVLPLGRAAAYEAPPARIDAGRPRPVWEASRRVRTFELVSRVHAAALVGDRPRPAPQAARSGAARPQGGGPLVPLPRPVPADGDLDLGESLRRRRTSFGLFSGARPLAAGDLAWVLSAVAGAGLAGTDVAPAPREHPWTGLHVISIGVEGLERRAYAYDAARGGLVPGGPVDVTRLQRLYALANYSIPEVGAILVVTGRLDDLVAAYGARGYRMLNIEAGHAAQTAYLAATARGIGCGAVLGLDNPGVDELLGTAGTGENSLIFILLGRERTPGLRYDHALYGFAAATREGTTR
ncbi:MULTISPECIES: SagB family peptide dehydrogenase [unclassified Nonomuraea]|uniref:SagB family peptide dehydrogenase n=1 Tax=unclassified Nonomuraea TaxID=2593643 RepID=UPI0035C04C2D